MPSLSNAITGGALIAALALTGCGGAGSSTARSSTPEIAFGSKAINRSQQIPVKYTCDGKDISPPLVWGALPANTQEVVLLLFSLEPVNPRPGQRETPTKLSVQWAVAGLKPTMHALPAGKLPPGALLGRNKDGRGSYSVCPAKGQVKGYLFRVYALSHKLSLRRGIPTRALVEQIGPSALARGEFFAGYKRV